MNEIKLNKSSLSQQRKALKNYQQFLPSLDLKRQKILVEKNKAVKVLTEIESQIQEVRKNIQQRLPMLADEELMINDLVSIESIDTGAENIVGINLPVLNKVDFDVTKNSLFNSPQWIDYYLDEFKKLIELTIKLQIAKQRTAVLEKALQTVTQRKNLFEKVLIPRVLGAIKTIQIFLADNERAAVVRSKITKNKRKLV